MKISISKLVWILAFGVMAFFLLQYESEHVRKQMYDMVFKSIFPVQYYVGQRYVNCDYAGDPAYSSGDFSAAQSIPVAPVTENMPIPQNVEIISVENETLPIAEPVAKVSGMVHESVGKFVRQDLNNFQNVVSRFYTVTSITELTEKQFDLQAALDRQIYVEKDAAKPQILIFHTHSQEDFVDSVPGDASTTIVGVGEHLANVLTNQYGYQVIHDTTVYDYVDGVLDRSKAYTYAERGIEKILQDNPSIEVVLDIHRDGVNENVHLTTQIDEQSTAKIMFFNGISHTKMNGDIEYLKNPYIQDNLALSLQMYLMGNSLYPGLMRKNYINGYRYCLHFRPWSMLVEVGAQNNTLEEECRAVEALAKMLDCVLSGEKAYD